MDCKMFKLLSVFLFQIIFLSNISVNDAFMGNVSDFAPDIFNIAQQQPIDENVEPYIVDPQDVEYFLYRKEVPSASLQISFTNPIIKYSEGYVVFIIHGWLENKLVDWYEDLKNAFLQRDDEYYQVIQVNWNKPAFQAYSASARSTQTIGVMIADFIRQLINVSNIPLEKFIIVGHSLGGQVAGAAGLRMFKTTDKHIPRIIALDPAGPYFNSKPIDSRLDPTDAKVVSVIHTDGVFGFRDPCGTIDFFPNGGVSQPGCTPSKLKDWGHVLGYVPCDHQRSWKYFIEAVKDSTAFRSKKCNSYLQFFINMCLPIEETIGNLQTTQEGKFYCYTNKNPPYSQHPDFANFINTDE